MLSIGETAVDTLGEAEAVKNFVAVFVLWRKAIIKLYRYSIQNKLQSSSNIAKDYHMLRPRYSNSVLGIGTSTSKFPPVGRHLTCYSLFFLCTCIAASYGENFQEE